MNCSQSLQIENWCSSCEGWSLHGFQTLRLGISVNPDTYSKLIPSKDAVLFDSNLRRHHFLGQVVSLDLLLCTGFYSEYAEGEAVQSQLCVHPVSSVHWHMFVNEGLAMGFSSERRRQFPVDNTTLLTTTCQWKGLAPQLLSLPGWRLPSPRWSCTVSCWKWPLICLVWAHSRTLTSKPTAFSVYIVPLSLCIRHCCALSTQSKQLLPKLPHQNRKWHLLWPKKNVIVASLALRIRQVYVIERNFEWRHLRMFNACIDKRCQLTVQDWRCCVHANHLNLGCTCVEVSFVNAYFWMRLWTWLSSFARFGWNFFVVYSKKHKLLILR